MAQDLGPPTWELGSWANDAWATNAWYVTPAASGGATGTARRVPLIGLLLRGLRAPDFK